MKFSSVSFFKQLVLTLAASVGHLTIGFVWGWSPTPLAPSLADWQIVGLTSGPALSAVFGCMLAAPLLHFLGRKRTLMLCCPLFVLGWFILGYSSTFPGFLTGRLITGISSGVVLPAAQIYVSECSHADVRGILGSLPALFKGVGVLLAYLLGSLLPWYWVSLVCATFPLAWFFVLVLLPESPVWLFSKKKDREGLSAFEWLNRGFNGQDVREYQSRDRRKSTDSEKTRKISSNDIANLSQRRSSVDIIRDSLELKQDRDGSQTENEPLPEESSSTPILKPLVIASVLVAFRQLTGIDSVIFYAVSIYEDNKIDMNDITAVILCIVQLVSTSVSLFIVDHSGRKPLLYVSGVLTSVATAALGTYFYYSNSGDASTLESLHILSLIGFMVGYSVGFCCVPFVIMGEILPERHRSWLVSFTSGVHFLMAFAVVRTYPTIRESIEYWIYSGLCLLCVVFVWFCVPETKGLSFEEIERQFKKPSKQSENVTVTGNEQSVHSE